MRITCILTIIAIGLSRPAMAAPQQFDLLCQGKTSTASEHIKPIEHTDDARYSVDLGRKLWCRHKEGACAKVKPVAAANGDRLTLSNDSGGEGDNRLEVDLGTGAYSSLIRVRPGVVADIVSTGKGRCTLAPFTPDLLEAP